MSNEYVLTTDGNGDLAIRTVVAEESSTANSTDVITATTDGKLAVRVVGSGGGGGDSHNLGWYENPTALNTAHPTAEAGDWAIVGSTDTVWLWDTDTSAWVDSDQKGQVTSVNGQTGAVTVQETLVNQTNIKSVDGNSLLGAGNLELSTYLTYPNGWTTNSTTAAFCADIAADTTATKGKAYLGEVTLSDLPASMANGEIVVEIMDGTTAADKVIVLSLKSGNVSPYAWQYVYWNNGSNVSGWKTWQEPLVSGTNIKTINGTSLLGSGDITTEAIQVSTMPTAAADELGKVYQFIGTTDANYTHGYFYECVSDGQTPATYSWSQLNVQPAPSGLPSQTGHSGEFLTTDGTDASWAAISALQNTATGTGALAILGSTAAGWCVVLGANASSSGDTSVVIGYNAKITGNYSYRSVCIGSGATVTSDACVCIGRSASASYSGDVVIGEQAKVTGVSNSAISIGKEATASAQEAYAIGAGAKATAQGAIQIGRGTNNVQNTLRVNTHLYETGKNVELLSADNTIPTDRFTTTPSADGTYVPTLTIASGVATRSWAAPSGGGSATATTATLLDSGWSSNSQTVNVTGVTASNNVIVSAAPASQSDYSACGIICTAQGAGTLTFTCDTVPATSITVNVLII